MLAREYEISDKQGCRLHLKWGLAMWVQAGMTSPHPLVRDLGSRDPFFQPKTRFLRIRVENGEARCSLLLCVRYWRLQDSAEGSP